MRENIALLALLYQTGRATTPAELRRRFEDGELPSDVLQTPNGPALFPEDVSVALAAAEAELVGWNAEGISVLTPFDDAYPSQMRSVFDYPLAIFARGAVKNDRLSAAIVGSREVSDSGLRFASDLASLLAEDSITVVSGLARGVDGAAHRAALAANGRTVAMLGNGLRNIYPAEHRDLQDEIAATGAVLSQFRPEARPSRQSFPQRNITMSAYSSITVIAEASEKSGTRIQANAAIKHARPLVLSSQVVKETSWGATYAGGGYDVTVVSSPDEGRAAVRDILLRTQQATRWLTRA